MKYLKYLLILFFVFLVISIGYVIWWNFVGIKYNPPKSPPPIPDSEKLMTTVNEWRYSQGLQPYTKSEEVCSFAQTRVSEVTQDWSHDGFYEREKNQSFPFEYKDLAENLFRGHGPEKEVLNAWLISPLHAENLHADYTHSCIKCEYTYCAQIFAKF